MSCRARARQSDRYPARSVSKGVEGVKSQIGCLRSYIPADDEGYDDRGFPRAAPNPQLVLHHRHAVFTRRPHLGESWGQTVELGLGGVQRYPWEDTYITLEIIEADPLLAKANPKLEIVGEHDYAIFHHITLLRIFRDVVLLFLAFCVIGLAYVAIKQF
jgi:hypothetical protein